VLTHQPAPAQHPSRTQQYVPLFLCKEDLGIAVQSAYKQRNATQIKLYRDKAKKHEDDFNQVSVLEVGVRVRFCTDKAEKHA
jgi:hypothetical protein